MLLKNAKSLGNSLGTANKKSLNISQNGIPILSGMHGGIERENSTLNDGPLYTLAKTGMLNNLTLMGFNSLNSSIGIEDLHFYFVSFNNHKTKVL